MEVGFPHRKGYQNCSGMWLWIFRPSPDAGTTEEMYPGGLMSSGGTKKDAGYGFKTRDMVPLRGQARTRQRKSPLVMSLERFLCCLMMSWDIFLHFDVATKSVLGWDTRWFLSVYDIRRSLNDVPINRVLVSWLCCVGMMCQRFPVSIYLFTTPPCSERPLPLDWVVWPVDWTRDREV